MVLTGETVLLLEKNSMTAEEIIMSVCKVKNKIDCTEKLEKEKNWWHISVQQTMNKNSLI